MKCETDASPDDDDQFYPAGRHVPQTSGEPSQGLPAWIAANPDGSLDNTDVVLWHTFGVVHYPSPEGEHPNTMHDLSSRHIWIIC